MVGSIYALVPGTLQQRAPVAWVRVGPTWKEPQGVTTFGTTAITVLPCEPDCSCGVCFWEGYLDPRRIWLDDERPAPSGWIHVYRAQEAIAYLALRNVVELSLDHDLGDDEQGTGYDVLLWIEEAVVMRGFAPPRIHVHSANAGAILRMNLAIGAIERLYQHHQAVLSTSSRAE